MKPGRPPRRPNRRRRKGKIRNGWRRNVLLDSTIINVAAEPRLAPIADAILVSGENPAAILAAEHFFAAFRRRRGPIQGNREENPT